MDSIIYVFFDTVIPQNAMKGFTEWTVSGCAIVHLMPVTDEQETAVGAVSTTGSTHHV